jgi:hypothetical protein
MTKDELARLKALLDTAIETMTLGGGDSNWWYVDKLEPLKEAFERLAAEPSLGERETATSQIPSTRGDIAASGPRNGPVVEPRGDVDRLVEIVRVARHEGWYEDHKGWWEVDDILTRLPENRGG